MPNFAPAIEKQRIGSGTLAQVVEQWTENPCVLGSTPRGTTTSRTFHKRKARLVVFMHPMGQLPPKSRNRRQRLNPKSVSGLGA